MSTSAKVDDFPPRIRLKVQTAILRAEEAVGEEIPQGLRKALAREFGLILLDMLTE